MENPGSTSPYEILRGKPPPFSVLPFLGPGYYCRARRENWPRQQPRYASILTAGAMTPLIPLRSFYRGKSHLQHIVGMYMRALCKACVN